MQPTASIQSSLRCPLNEVFGSRGQVRLLRVLATDAHRPLHPSEVARRAGMTASSARKALHRLTRTGLVEQTPIGRGNRFALSRHGSLAREVARLFEVERDRASALQQSLRNAVRGLGAPPALAWVQEFLAGWADRQEVAVFFPGDPQPQWLDELEERLAEVEEEFEVLLEVRAFSVDDLPGVDWSRTVMLVGVAPGVEDSPPSPQGHPQDPDPENGHGNGKLNPRSSEFSGALVALLEENLSVVRRARENVRGQLREGANGQGHDLWEWQKILDTFSLPRLLNFLGSETPRAVRLRECSPFPAVLSEEEKARLEELATRPN